VRSLEVTFNTAKLKTQLLDIFAASVVDAIDELVAEYLKTLDNSNEVEMYLTERDYAETVLILGWYDGQPGFMDWLKERAGL